jgi:hypothetical protein
LSTYEIDDLIRAVPYARDKFLGVYSSDNLPTVSRWPCGFICNTDDSAHVGEHWTSFFFDPRGHACYSDPLGLPPLYDTWENYLKSMSKDGQWFYTTKTLQHPLASTCGYHAVFNILCRCRGMTAHEVMNMYSSNLNENDDFVLHAVHKLILSG